MTWYTITYKMPSNGEEKQEMILVAGNRISRDLVIPGMKAWFPCGTQWHVVSQGLAKENFSARQLP